MRTLDAETTERPGSLNDFHIYCDEDSDLQLVRRLSTISTQLKRIPDSNITVYPPYARLEEYAKKSGSERVRTAIGRLVDLVREDRPDFVFTYRGSPVLVVELTEHGYTGDNPLQRFTRFASAAEHRVPFVYFTPFSRVRDDELDNTDDVASLSRRKVNSNVFLGMSRLTEIFHVPQIAIDWSLATNGKPRKVSAREGPEALREVFGSLVDTIDLFISDLGPRVAAGEDIRQAEPMVRAITAVRTLAASPNVRASAVKLSLPGDEIRAIVLDPRTVLRHISPKDYFFADKPERLIVLRCIQQSEPERVETSRGAPEEVTDLALQLEHVVESPRFGFPGMLYCTGYKWRSDPHCGVTVNLDYVSCRPGNELDAASRNRALVLQYPRVFLRKDSRPYRTVTRELEQLGRGEGPFLDMLKEKYSGTGEDVLSRATDLAGIEDAVGIWSDSTKQARIFRKYCDLIVLGDAILLGNHWRR